MNKNLGKIAKELFGKLRTQFPKIQLGDEESKVTDEAENARVFKFEYTHNNSILGNMTVNISDEDGLVVIYSNDIIEDQDEFVKNNFFNFLQELREFAKQRLMTFDTRDISKSNLEKRDYEQMSKKNGEPPMSESKLFGTSKTSYQQLGDAKLIVKHTAPVNFENPAGRAQRIESIYIENLDGERFRYPYKHLNGARALAQHVAHGGTPYDSIGKYVIGLSEELSNLRMFKNYVERNPMVSEAMGSIHSKVLERIDGVKKEIQNLQSATRYTEFVESFEENAGIEIPEDIINDWVDRLTIRTFNEELKNVFPYIFKLVDESDIPVKDLTIEDLVNEEDDKYCDACDRPSTKCICDDEKEVKEFVDYEKQLGRIIGERTDIFSDKDESKTAAIDKLNQLVANPLPVGTDGNNAIESLTDIIDDNELMDIFKEIADIDPELDARDFIKQYIEIKDKENGTDVLSQIEFPADSEAPAEEPPAEEPAAEPTAEPAPAEPAPAEPAPAEPAPNPVAEALARAVRAGAREDTIITINGMQMTLGEAAKKAGVKTEDIFSDKATEIVEFVKSMFNTEEGTFPKGEEGVLIACEKKFGEAIKPVAVKIIEKLHMFSEMQRMKKLAGVR